MKGMILAAGFGTRLWPLTEDRTKPAVPFLGTPLVVYSVEYLRDHGIQDIMVNLHHRPESVRSVLGDGSAFGVRIQYSIEEEILGTGGALDRVRDWLEDGDFAVVNGKIVTDLDLSGAIRAHAEREAIATLVLKPNHQREHFTIVDVGEGGAVRGFDGFPDDPEHRASGDGPPPPMFTGIQVLSPRIFEFIPRARFSHTTMSAFPAAIERGELVLGYACDGVWREMSTLERYLGESLAVMRERGMRFVLGQDSRIAEGAEVEESVLWSGVRVEAGASLRRCIVGDGVRIPGGRHYEDAVIVRAEIVEAIERGESHGENLVVPLERVLD